jgi:UDP-N-acetylglucosamine transferase subunit ALG13
LAKPLIYVTTGTNQYSFDRMLTCVDSCLNALDFSFEVILQYGSSKPYNLKSVSKNHDFYSREFSEECYEKASLIFSHCGIGSIYNSLKYNTPTVIIPRLEKYNEFSDDHQLQIAREVARNPLICMYDDGEKDFTSKFLRFMADTKSVEKKEIDLVDNVLAEKIVSFF